MRKSQEFLPIWIKKKFGVDYSLTTYNDESMTEFAEAHKNHCVNAISDEDIEKEANSYDNILSSMSESIYMPKGFKEGAKWYRNELLKQ